MKFYKTEDKLIFGKYKEMTLIEIAKKDQLYISWCAINLAHFYIDEKVISDMKEIVPSFKISQLAKDSFQSKYKEWLAEEENEEEEDISYYSKPSFGRYAGSYAQDIAGLSDDFISDALDGFPEAYWNID